MSLLREFLVAQPMIYGPISNAFRRSHEIEGSTGGAQTDYQVQITVYYGEGDYTTENISIVIHASCVLSDDTTLLAVRPDGTVYKSEDDGESFAYLSTLPDVDGAARFMFCAANGYVYVLYQRGAAAKGRIYRSIDDGANWTTECEAEANAECWWWMCEDSSGNLYAAGYSIEAPPSSGHAKVWKSTDNGDIWVMIHDFGANYRHCHAIGVNPHNGWLYVLVGDAGVVVGDDAGIFRSKDSGASWTRIYGGATTNPFNKTGLAFTGNDNYVYVGSDDAGQADVSRGDDDGTAAIAFPNVWSSAAGYTGQLLWMVKTSDGRLVLLSVAQGAGQRSFIAMSDTTNWAGAYTYLVSIVSTGPWRDFYGPPIDKFSENKIGLARAKAAGADTNGIRIYIAEATGEDIYMNNKCRTDFGDIRFRQGETELDYWIEEKTDGDDATFWVKIPTIPADPNSTTIHIYYGKSDETTTSSGSSTFPILFQDFEDETVGVLPSGWTKRFGDAGDTFLVAEDQVVYGTKSAKYHEVNVAQDGVWDKNMTSALGLGILHAWFRIDNNNRAHPAKFYSALNLPTNLLCANEPASNKWRYRDNVPAWADLPVWTAPAADTWYRIEMYIRTADNRVRFIKDRSEDSGWLLVSAFANLSLVNIRGFNLWPTDSWIDDLYARKWVDPEPAHGDWGDEEATAWPF